MTGRAIPDVLGPLEIATNAAEPIALRQRVRLLGGAPALFDVPSMMASGLATPAYAHRFVEVGADVLASSQPIISGLSDADLLRMHADNTTVVIFGILDSAQPSAAPRKPVKYVANVGAYTITLTAAAPGSSAAPFLSSRTLTPDMTVRVVWDAASGGYRVFGGSIGEPSDALLSDDGQPLVFDGDGDYIVFG